MKRAVGPQLTEARRTSRPLPGRYPVQDIRRKHLYQGAGAHPFSEDEATLGIFPSQTNVELAIVKHRGVSVLREDESGEVYAPAAS